MNPHTDEILEGLRPRMKAARVAHVRRMMACLAMVPILGVGAVAMAADGTDEERARYDERCRQIATEMFYLMARAATFRRCSTWWSTTFPPRARSRAPMMISACW